MSISTSAGVRPYSYARDSVLRAILARDILRGVKDAQHGRETQSDGVFERIIGIGKLIKAALLLGVAIGIFRLIHEDIAAWIQELLREIHVDPDNAHIHWILERALALTPDQIRRLSIGSFLYGSLYLVEGIGLLRRKHWAEYLTIATTSVLLPVEVYELCRRITATRSIVFAINVAVVVYLIARVRSRRKRLHAARGDESARSG